MQKNQIILNKNGFYITFFFFKGMVVCCVIQTGSELLDSSGLPASASGVIGTISP